MAASAVVYKQIQQSKLCCPDLGSLATVSFIIPTLGLVAQSVEQRIENPCVGGSIPPRATKKHQNHLRVVFSFVGLMRLYWLGCAPRQKIVKLFQN